MSDCADTAPRGLLAGAAMRTINPPLGLALIGYPKERPNTGVAVDLCARAVVFGALSDEAPAAALVVLDTLGVDPEVVRRIRHAAAERIAGLAPQSIMVAASHTHSAPSLCRVRFSGQDVEACEAYVQQAVTGAAEALAAAWENRAEVTARVGRTEIRLGHNRRVVDADGRASNVWEDPAGLHSGIFNPNVRILILEEVRTCRPRAVIALYGCHPVTLGPGNTQASADYPGHFCGAVEAALPGCVGVHLTGAAGQINPRRALSADPEQARPAGEALAAVVLEELPYARLLRPTPVRPHVEPLTLPLGPDARQNYSRRAVDSIDGKTIQSEVQVLRLGGMALVSAPGELFAELGLAIENISPFDVTFVVGYANDNLGYLCTDSARREGGYEPKNAISLEIEQRLLPTARRALERALACASSDLPDP